MKTAKDRAKDYWEVFVTEKRTSIIGIANILFFLSGCLMLWVGKFTVGDFSLFLTLANSAVFSVLAMLAADGKKSIKTLHQEQKEFYD